ncbi:MAG: DUF6089 family protein [Bacteroidota bacterium]
MKKLLLLVLLFGNGLFAKAQTNVDFGIIGGTTLYSGDLSPVPAGFTLDDLGLSGGIFLRYQFKKWIAFRPGLTFVQLKGEDRRPADRFLGLNFQTNVYELSGIFEISPVSIGYYSSNTVVVPYLAMGIGAFRFNPTATYGGVTYDLQPLGTEGQGLEGRPALYSRLGVNIPIGGGIKFVINDNITIGYELMGRILRTDYIDDVSGTSVRYGDLLENRGEASAIASSPNLSPETNPDFTYSRGGNFNDFYFLSMLHVSFRFRNGDSVYRPGKKGVMCPRF